MKTRLLSTIFGIFLAFSFSLLHAQENNPLNLSGLETNDTIRQITFDINQLKANQTQESELGGFMRPMKSSINPSSMQLPRSLTNNYYYSTYTKRLPISFSGYGSDEFFNPERTLVLSMNVNKRLSFYSANTIGVYRTLMHGNLNHYELNLGANYRFSSVLSGQGGAFFNSMVTNPLPIAGVYSNFNYRAADGLWLDGGMAYKTTLNNMYDVNQKALLMNMHARYQLADDWFLNGYGGLPLYQSNHSDNNRELRNRMLPVMSEKYYGGTVEYWFQKEMGVEAGVIWIRDMFTGKMRPSPKIELKFGPKR